MPSEIYIGTMYSVYQLTLLFPMCYYFEFVLKLISYLNSAHNIIII